MNRSDQDPWWWLAPMVVLVAAMGYVLVSQCFNQRIEEWLKDRRLRRYDVNVWIQWRMRKLGRRRDRRNPLAFRGFNTRITVDEFSPAYKDAIRISESSEAGSVMIKPCYRSGSEDDL